MYILVYFYYVIQELVCYGMVYNLCVMKVVGFEVDCMVVCGGVMKSCDWIQMYVDVFGVLIVFIEVGDVVVFGICMVVVVGVGLFKDFFEVVIQMVYEIDFIELDQECYEEY